jgi:bifunctional enzyme CysN/CysC
MSQDALAVGKKYFVKHQSRTIRAIVGPVKSRLNLKTLKHEAWGGGLELNEIGRVSLRLASTIVCDQYEQSRGTGGLIVIDEATNSTVGAGLILG